MGSVRKWFQSASFLVYLSHFLSAWGDNMWIFAVGLFLIQISPESLQLTAIYGLSVGGAVLLFGAVVGDWIDRNPRLKAAQVTLMIQNSSVMLCAATICIYMIFNEQISQQLGGHLSTVFHGIIIVFAIFAQLGSVGNKISIQRDWIIEICGRDKEVLANMSAVLRRIDLVTKIVAPIATGQIMGFTTSIIAAIVIAGWNLVSMFIEYFLIWKVYIRVPTLAVKRYKKKGTINEADNEKTALNTEKENPDQLTDMHTSGTNAETTSLTNEVTDNDGTNMDQENAKLTDDNTDERPPIDVLDYEIEIEDDGSQRTSTDCNLFCSRVCQNFIMLYKGWKTYSKYRVAFAGVALAFLYMTVLGFDNVTTGYAYSQGMSEWVLGLLMAAGALFGIMGTLAYPVFRRKIGLERSGLFSMSFEIVCLSLCVMSIWAPGSPFDPFYFSKVDESANVTLFRNCSSLPSSDTGLQDITLQNTTSASHEYGISPDDCNSQPKSYLSLILLMVGIVLARFGLWISDLTITQLFLEQVDETERGVVNGVQDSINMLMDMLKFGLVVALPQTPTFGYLIILSFVFICLGGLLYAVYSRKVRGHIMPHITKLSCSDQKNNNTCLEMADVGETDDVSIPITKAS